MPWLWVLVVIAGVYLLVKIIQGIREFIEWLGEPRIDPKAYKRAKREAKEHQRV